MNREVVVYMIRGSYFNLSIVGLLLHGQHEFQSPESTKGPKCGDMHAKTLRQILARNDFKREGGE